MKKRLFSLLTVLAMVLSVMPVAAFAEDGEAAVSGNLLKVTTEADFAAGTLENLEIVPGVGNGAVRLTDGATEGTYVSPVYTTAAWAEGVASWSASIHDGSQIEVWARARIGEAWTEFMTWGAYSPFISRGTTANKSDALAYISLDEFMIRDGAVADAVQMMVVVSRENAGIESPEVRQIAMSFTGGEMEAVYTEETVEIPAKAFNPAPGYRQSGRSSIGGSMCSPTTISVMLNSRDPSLNIIPEALANTNEDNAASSLSFGNWSFSSSAPGLFGYDCYMQYISKDILLQELAQGRTVGISVKYGTTEGGSYPYLENAYSDTSGHLISIIGYEYEDGIMDDEHLYFISSDSYSASDTDVYRRYKWTQLDECWSNRVAYIIPSLEPEANATTESIVREHGVLVQDENDSTLFTMEDEQGNTLDLNNAARGSRTILAYTVEGFKSGTAEKTDHSIAYEEAFQVEANNTFTYSGLELNEDGQIVFNASATLADLGLEVNDPHTVTIYVMGSQGYIYSASAKLSVSPDKTVVVTPEGSSVVASEKDGKVLATLNVDNLEGDLTVGLLIPENGDVATATVTVDGEATQILDVYTDENGVSYAVVKLDPSEPQRTVVINWGEDSDTYVYDLLDVVVKDEIVTVESGNVIEADLTAGTITDELVRRDDGSIALKKGETEGIYTSPVYDSWEWEYAMGFLGAYTPTGSSADLQIRAYTQRGQTWSKWLSMGSAGDGSTSISEQDAHTNMSTDVYMMRGSSSEANAERFQLRVVLTSEDGSVQPAVYHAGITYKKSVYDPDEAVYYGETSVEDLPASAGIDAQAYSAYAYGVMSSWRFENMELIMMNALGSDLLFEEVALANYDHRTGWGNWAMTNYKPGAFGHSAYTQFGANSTLVQQAIADGNMVGVYVNGSKLPSDARTNSSSTSQTVVVGYYTAEDGTVMFKVICPRGDVSELNAGKVYGEVSAADLDAAIEAYYNGSSSGDSVRGLMYVVGGKEYEASWQRIEAEAEMVNTDNDAFVLYVDGNALELDPEFISNYESTSGGIISYTLTSATDPEAKLAAGDFSYGITVNSDGTLAVSDSLKTALLAGDTANIYVIANNGVTYVAELAHTHLWDEGVETVAPSTKNEGEVLYTCEYCGETYIEYLPEIITPVGPSLSQTTVSKSVTAANKKLNALAKLDTVTLEDQEAIEEARAAYDALSDEEKEQVENYDELLKAEAALAALLNTGSEPFADVTDGDWFQDSVIYVYENGLMNGVTADSFAPQANTTRGMIVTILWRMAGEPAPNGVNGFADVAAGSYYEQAITWAAEAGIVTGYTDTQFKPDDSITREQLAVILFRYAQFRGLTSVVLSENLWFNDADQISSYAVSAMNWAVYEELITGTGNGNVEPQGYANRAQVATILARFCQNIQ